MGKIENYRKINSFYLKARDMALEIIAEEAEKLIKDYPIYTEFRMGMGTVFF